VHVLLVMLIAIWAVLDIPYVMHLLDSRSQGEANLAITMAEKQRVFPLAIRPLIAGWWLMHFAVGMWLAILLAASESFHHSAGVIPICFIGASSLGFAANGYLLVAIASLTRSEHIRRWTWRLRLPIDVSLGLISTISSTMWPILVRHLN
jgi:hypothetical protein